MKVLVLILTFFMLILCSRDRSAETIHEGFLLRPCTFKTESISYSAECGSVTVPESSRKESSRLITLPVTRIHSVSSEPAEPIFYLGGGPGQTNMKFEPPADLLANHDFVMIGYRGADGSVILDCPEVSRAIKGVGNDLLGLSSLQNLDTAFMQCADRLMAEGIDLDAYTMIDVIRDLEAVRMALGYNRINLLSQSYGTRIAQIYAYQHPDIINRSAMIGVNPPGCFVWEPDTIDHQIKYYARLWEQDPRCKIESSDLEKTMENVLGNMPEHWLFFPIDKGKVKLITFALLYHRNTAAQVFDTYVAAEKGDASGLALMTLAYNFMFPSMIIWGDLASKAYSADFDPVRDYMTEMDPPNSILGSPFSKMLMSLGSWPTAAIPDEFRKARQTDVTTLLVNGSIDFSTPAGNATRNLLPYLTNGKQVILKEMGHTHDIWTVQRPATLHLLTSFFDTGVADNSMFTYSPMMFHVSMGFPLITKLALACIFLICLGFFGLARIVIRRIRR